MKAKWKSYHQAKAFLRLLNISTKMEYMRICKQPDFPDDIPHNPRSVYYEDWKGWSDYLGTGRIANQCKQYRSYEDARTLVSRLSLKTSDGYKKWLKMHKGIADLPINADQVYKRRKQWISWPHYLGIVKDEDLWYYEI